MPRSLADYDADRGQYVRAEQPWTCGRICEGAPCTIGPDQNGRCQIHLECVPMKQGDRWQCTRPKAAGGKCPDGPLPDGSCPHCPAPCQPRRSLLARRKMLTVFVAAAALGCLFLFAGGESKEEFLSPGKLSVHHHALQQQCTRCHTAQEGHAMLRTVGAENAIDQSFKCLDCHQFGEHALNPHGVSPGHLSKSTHRIENSSFAANPPAWLALAKWGPGIPQDEKGRLACAVCHQEHRGSRHELKRISERNCHICHNKPFHSFSKDHPEFTNFPHKRRTRIHFDHSSHYGRHFGVRDHLPRDVKPPQSCNACHVPDPSGAQMLVRGFDQSCASCHGPEIQLESKLPGVPFIRLPALDEAASKWKGVDPWPRLVSSGALPDNAGPIEQLTPFMLLLLNSDPEFRKAQRALNGVNLSQLHESAAWNRATGKYVAGIGLPGGVTVQIVSQRHAVAAYVKAIRQLFRDLGNRGEPELQRRLESALGAPLDREMQAAVASPRSTGSLLIDAVRVAGEGWFPPPPNGKAAGIPPAGDALKRFGNWNVRFDDFSIRHRPRLHADPFLRFWLDTSAANFARTTNTGSATPQSALAQMFRQLADPAVPGSCVKCHTVDRQPDATLAINWRSFRPAPYRHAFTRFSHHPHLKELGRRDAACGTCHVRKQDVKLFHPQFTQRNWLPNFHGGSPLSSGFAAIQRADCAKCHTPKIAPQSCLQCHNYHVGEFPPRE